MSNRKARPERERPIRHRHKKSKLPLILILLAVIGGGVVALHKSGKVDVAEEVEKAASKGRKALTRIKKKAGAISSSSPRGEKKSVAEVRDPEGGKKGERTTARKIDPKANEKAQTVYREAKGQFDQGQFKLARQHVDQFLRDGPRISLEAEQQLQGLRKRSFQHFVLTKDYRLDGRLHGDTTELKMIDGRTLEVRITSKDDEQIRYVWKGIRSAARVAAILSQRVIPADELQARDMAKYEAMVGQASGGGPRAFLVVIKYCVERDMRSKIRVTVEQAEQEQRKDATQSKIKLRGFFEELFEAKASILYQRYLAFVQSGETEQKQALYEKIVSFYPDTTIASELSALSRAGGQAPELQEEKKVIARLEKKLAPKEVKTNNASARTLLKEGDRLYALAMKEYRMSFPDQPDYYKHLRPAWDLFKKAQVKYEAAYAADSRPSIEDKIAICQREIYSCQKQMKIR